MAIKNQKFIKLKSFERSNWKCFVKNGHIFEPFTGITGIRAAHFNIPIYKIKGKQKMSINKQIML